MPPLQIEIDPPPLESDEHGTVRVSGSRVSLESLIWLYRQGYPPDALHESFPSVPLSDIHAVIAYYLRHRQAVEAYLEQARLDAEEIRRQVESQPGYRERREQLVARLEAEAKRRGLRK